MLNEVHSISLQLQLRFQNFYFYQNVPQNTGCLESITIAKIDMCFRISSPATFLSLRSIQIFKFYSMGSTVRLS